ncbi:hypothetical protein GCM10023116_05270 [Kistimonas scapharcae]|uniref:Lipopolysaccharide kinase n=1 Tax=Kistimonas scapharcae TaxID=1036133 RepID=A0ABP8UZH2_9GAMM
MESFLNEDIANQFARQGLGDFTSLWDLKLDWFEPVNERRDGWSGVSRYTLPGDHPLQVFIKRQQNHNTRQLLHPIRGVPTFQREYHNIQLFRSYDIPTLTPLYFGERRTKNNDQAILITLALEGYTNLFDWYRNIAPNQPEATIQQVLESIAHVARRLHDQGLAHYCLYPNHIFVRTSNTTANALDANPEIIRLIDLEKARWQPINHIRRFKDLECFMRHAQGFSLSHIHHLLDCYFGEGAVPGGKRLYQRLMKALKEKKQRLPDFYRD